MSLGGYQCKPQSAAPTKIKVTRLGSSGSKGAQERLEALNMAEDLAP